MVDDSRNLPTAITTGRIVKEKTEEGTSRYDFHYTDRYGYPGVLGGISHMFRQEFWNYAKLISGVIRNGMPIVDILNLVKGLNLDDESINTWKNGVERALTAPRTSPVRNAKSAARPTSSTRRAA